ncbi:hypothetical protein WJX73_002323 [Symbiochloris irregularis]|uniref:Peregrin n=1 Tax=Symbiochloris irregularis TaxID=706552 RepID=A0AAW1PSA8_9CHLO
MQALLGLPAACPQPCLTLTEAQARAQQIAEDKRKKELAREKQKAKSHVATQDHLHGVIPGAEEEKSTYWLFIEAFFRDLTRDDLAGILPVLGDPEQDPAYHIPPLGALRVSEQHPATLQRALTALPAAKAVGTGPSAPPQQALQSEAAATPTSSTAGNSAMEDVDRLRKSRRLVAKSSLPSQRISTEEELPSQDSNPGLLAHSEASRTQLAAAQAAVSALRQGDSLVAGVRPEDLALLAAQVLDGNKRSAMQSLHVTAQAGLPAGAAQQAASRSMQAEAAGQSDSLHQGVRHDEAQHPHLAAILRHQEANPPAKRPRLALQQGPAAAAVSVGADADDSQKTKEDKHPMPHPDAVGDAKAGGQGNGAQADAATPSLPPSRTTSLGGRQRNAVNYSRLAGVKNLTGVKKSVVPNKGQKRSSMPKAPRPIPASHAAASVAALIAAGHPEGPLEEQWQQLEAAGPLLAQAPEDELVGEILALQAELALQQAANRRRVAGALQHLLPQLQAQLANAEDRTASVEFIVAYQMAQKACKRSAKREKREAQLREAAAAAAEAALTSVPRKARPARHHAAGDHAGLGAATTPAFSPSPTASPAPESASLYDKLATRQGADDDAMCAVCGGGLSLEPDLIVFCERCDVAVHQKCYGLHELPQGEWVCWPCRKHEARLLAQGMPPAQVRPPRYLAGSAGALEGGARSTHCALCPVRCGAFRQTTDSRHWVHQVCALWHPETSVQSGSACNAVEGKSQIKAERWGRPCSVCRQTHGAVVLCSTPHCSVAFHPLCARNSGCYLARRPGPHGTLLHRAYCRQHSEVQQERDRAADEAELQGAPGGGAEHRREAKRLDKEERAAIAHAAMASKVQERRALAAARNHMEGARMLMERVHKREKTKLNAAKAAAELWRLRLGPGMELPDGGAAFLHDEPLAPPSALAPQPSLARDSSLGTARTRRATERGLSLAGGQRSTRPRSAQQQQSPESLQVNTHRMLTTAEADNLNAQLQQRMEDGPFMYVPIQSLRSRPTRASAAAAHKSA